MEDFMSGHKPVSPKPAVDSIATLKRRAKQADRDLGPLVARLNQLVNERNLSKRFAAMQAGLDHQGILRIEGGRRPDMVSCILLADFFDINPNELLELAGWPMLKALQVRSVEELPPEVVEVALDLAKIEDVATRREVAGAIRILLKKHFPE
jgi:transcriptional regulator with XRE-family HTH domain